jgi:PST family polysaccharide transporter
MRSILKATAVLGSASILTMLIGLLSAKMFAVLLGPGGYGSLGVLQSLLGLSGMIAGVGVSAGLVRNGARALADGDVRQVAAFRAGAWLLCGFLGGPSAILMILFRVPLSNLVLGTPDQGGAVAITAIGVVFALIAGIQLGILTAHHQVRILARCTVVSTVLGALFSVPMIWWWGSAGIPWAVLASCVASWSCSAYYVQQYQPRPDVQPSRREVLLAAGVLLRFGAPYTASLLVCTGFLIALPVFALHAINAEAAGLYRAAATLAVAYWGVLGASFSQDYYPRVSAVANQKEALCQLINQQHRIVLLLGGPIILGILTLGPYLVPLVFSQQFASSAVLLEWQLLGDVFRLAAWTMAFVVLAHSGSFIYFCLELVGGLTLLILSWMGMRWVGLEGLGLGLVGFPIIYYLVCWGIMRRTIGFQLTKQNVMHFATVIAFAFSICLLRYLGFEKARTPVAFLLTAIVSAYSFHVLWREVGGFRGLRASMFQSETLVPPQPGQRLFLPRLTHLAHPTSE